MIYFALHIHMNSLGYQIICVKNFKPNSPVQDDLGSAIIKRLKMYSL
jgi:hypothetical protein